MQIIEVPIVNDDGSIRFTQYVTAEEAQKLLQFAINFMMAVGNQATIMVGNGPDEEIPQQLDS